MKAALHAFVMVTLPLLTACQCLPAKQQPTSELQERPPPNHWMPVDPSTNLAFSHSSFYLTSQS